MAQTKVLVVDDMPFNRLILGRMFTKLGFQVVEAQNGEECLQVYTQQRNSLSCVFLDLKMPVMDGWTAAKKLRLLEESQSIDRIPIVACTATQLDEIQGNGETCLNRALSSGIDECVCKPVSLPLLCDILQRYIPQFYPQADSQRQYTQQMQQEQPLQRDQRGQQSTSTSNKDSTYADSQHGGAALLFAGAQYLPGGGDTALL